MPLLALAVTNVENTNKDGGSHHHTTMHQLTDIDLSLHQTELHTRTVRYATSTTPAITISKYGFRPKVASATTQPTASTSSPANQKLSILAATNQHRGTLPKDETSIAIASFNLDKYFENLKKEFVDKTGREWIPLTANNDTDWDWEKEWGYGDSEDLDLDTVDVDQLNDIEGLSGFEFDLELVE